MTTRTTQNPITTLTENVLQMRERSPAQTAIMYKADGQWIKLTWQQYYKQIEVIAAGLLQMGIKPGDRVAIFANTRFEWCVMDYAIMGIGAIVVPVYQTVTADDLQFILNDCQARAIVVENKATLKTFEIVRARCASVETVFAIENSAAQDKKVIGWQQLQSLGGERLKNKTEEFAALCAKPKSSDTATLLYTSGTTGMPKGVVLTHLQGISEVSEAFPYEGVTTEDIALTFLPYAHILGRIEHWGQTYIGYTLAFAESIEKIKQNLVEIRPTIMVAVPRIFEKVYSGLWTQVESNFAVNKLFRWALAIGLKVGDLKLKHEPIPLPLLAQYRLAHKLALGKVKEAFGGRLKFAISGGAPMPREIAYFFHACEILILEGYGLTETTAAITVNAPFDYHFGSVGKPIGEVQLKIAEDGEVLVKSDKVMKEYYNNPQATKEAFIDGWFCTGDIGEILPSGDLKITDRKKDLIKTAGGKYVAPQRLENLLKTHSFISQILIHGDQRKFIVALLTLDKPYILNFARDKNINYTDYASLTQHPQVLELVRKAVAETNSHLAHFETIKRFAVLPNDFTVEAGELTPSLKVKRKFLDKKFSRQIESLYQ